MATFATLNEIRRCWNNPELKNMDKQQFCAAILPDSFDHTCSAQPELYDLLRMPERTMSKFLNGNRHDKDSDYFAHSGLTKAIMDQIRYDRQILYQDPTRECRTRKSMISKLEKWINQTLPKMDANHPLFTKLRLVDLDAVEDATRGYLRQLVACVETLCRMNTSRSLAYALFLMILTAICRQYIASLPELYSQRILQELDTSDSMELGTNFTDPGYMGDFHIYTYRSLSDRLFRKGSLSLRLDQDGQCTAELQLLAVDESHDDPRPPTNYTYKGKALYNDRDKMVYIPMKDQYNSLGVVVFLYEQFLTGPLYYRTALFLSNASRTKCPQVRRMALCARKLEDREIPYVKGVLKTGRQQIVVTEQQLEDFCSMFRNYPWMEEFKRVFLPFIRSHACYCLDEGEILANSTSRLDELDRLRMMLALKSVMSWKNYNRVDTADPSDLHKLMR